MMFSLGRPIRPAAPSPADVAAKLRRAPDDLSIIPGFNDQTTPSEVLRELGRVVAQRDKADAEVVALREQMAQMADLVLGGLAAYRLDRRAGGDALLDLYRALIPASGPSAPVIPGGAA